MRAASRGRHAQVGGLPYLRWLKASLAEELRKRGVVSQENPRMTGTVDDLHGESNVRDNRALTARQLERIENVRVRHSRISIFLR